MLNQPLNPVASILNRLAPQQQMLQELSQIAKAPSPQAMFQQMIQNDPRFKQVIDFINKNGGDAKTLFYKEAQNKGKDPNEIINQAKSMLSR